MSRATGKVACRIPIERVAPALRDPSEGAGVEVLESLRDEADPTEGIPAMIGKRFRVQDSYRVGREKVREHARAVQNFHSAHWDEDAAAAHGYPALVAPPTFTTLLMGGVQTAMSELLDGVDLTTTVQTEQTMHYHAPILVDDEITSNVSLHSFRQAFGGDMFVIENAITNQRDDVVVTALTSVIARTGGQSGSAEILRRVRAIGRQDFSSPPAVVPWTQPLRVPDATVPGPLTRAFDSVSAGQELPPGSVRLTLGDLVNYAGVSGDPNPIHFHADTAHLVGLERGVVAHGMLTMALGGGYLSSWLDDPGALRQYSVRMTSPVYVGFADAGVIEFRGKVKSVDEQARTAVVALTATHEDKKIFGRALATVALS